MGQLVSFENHTIARLRAAETARADLLAFARGHSEAVASIHRAVLEAMAAEDFIELCTSVAADWPALLGVDSAVLALVVGDHGFRIDREGVSHLDPAMCERALNGVGGAILRPVTRGHALFGNQAVAVRAEALVPIGEPGLSPHGLLLLGHRSPVDPGASHGVELLEFLGDFLAAMMRRWLNQSTARAMAPTPPAP